MAAPEGHDDGPRQDAPDDFSVHLNRLTHFPVGEELRDWDARWGFSSAAPSDEALRRLDPRLRRSSPRAFLGTVPSRLFEIFRPVFGSSPEIHQAFIKAVAALRRPRLNHSTLDASARARFNAAVQAMEADGSYQALAAIHAQHQHNMHGIMGPVGEQRFLPWHRVYLFVFESALRVRQPVLTVPYWDYANDHARPDWVHQPVGVLRNAPRQDVALPTQSDIDAIKGNRDYASFTRSLERRAHNRVHNWLNGTVTNPNTAAQDPIFWLLHANVDRVWDEWRRINFGSASTLQPTLSPIDSVLDPWSQTAEEVDRAVNLGYSYT